MLNETGIRIPASVPAVIHSRALYFYRRAQGHNLPAAMIRRLIIDERMKTVWEKLCPPSASESECEACLRLFNEAVIYFRHPILIQPPSDYAERASRLREDANKISKRRPQKKFGRLADKLQKAAKAYDELAQAELPHKGIKRAVCDLSESSVLQFGSPHHEIIATIASVALDRKVSRDDVRNWVRAKAVKMTKKS
jgi:hypothetical protein